MIIHETRNINGTMLHYYISDSDYMIQQIDTEELYDEAYCIKEEDFTETSILKENYGNEED